MREPAAGCSSACGTPLRLVCRHSCRGRARRRSAGARSRPALVPLGGRDAGDVVEDSVDGLGGRRGSRSRRPGVPSMPTTDDQIVLRPAGRPPRRSAAKARLRLLERAGGCGRPGSPRSDRRARARLDSPPAIVKDGSRARAGGELEGRQRSRPGTSRWGRRPRRRSSRSARTSRRPRSSKSPRARGRRRALARAVGDDRRRR